METSVDTIETMLNRMELEIALLGRPEVRWQGQPVTFRTRKALALLACLAAEPGPHRRDDLAVLLWPESEPAQARATLQHLRQALPDSTDPPLLAADRDALSLTRRPGLALDLDLLAEADRRLRADKAARPADLQPVLEAAAAAYRGEFMQSFALSDVPAFDHWVQSQQPAWRERAAAVFEALLQAQVEAGDRTRALATARAWAAADRLSDAAARWQMQLLLALGQPAEALRLFEAHSAALQRELQAPPDPALSALAERIRRQGGAAPAPGPAGASATAKPAAQAAAPPLMGVQPLVGRASEFANLVSLMHTFRSGRPQAVLIAGEAGIGKSRLAREFLASALAEGLEVWEARAFESVGHVPYQVVLDALRARVERENAPDDLLADVWLAELSRLLPELRERYPDLPPPLSIGEAEAQARLFEAVARLVHALTARGPVVFFVDDLQWADAASLDLLLYLARQAAERGSRLLLLLAARAEDLPALAAWLDALGRALPVTRLALGTLTLAHTQQWVQAMAGYAAAAPPEALLPALRVFSEWLHAETGGQPFFITETLRAMREQGLIGRPPAERELSADRDAAIDVLAAAAIAGDPAAARAALGLPAGVRDIVRTRTQRLSPAAAELLAAGAVIGQAATFEALRAVAALDEPAALRALDELLAAHLLQEIDAEPETRYLITHDKIRAVTYAGATSARRRAFHRRVFETLSAGSAPAAAADLAYHALAAGLSAEGARWSVAAGDQAMSVFDVRQAIAHYARAREALGGALEAVDPQAYLRLARALELSGDMAQAEATYTHALEVARAARTPALEVTALSRLAMIAIQRFDERRMHEWMAPMLASAQASGDLLLQAQAEWTLAQAYNYLARLPESAEHGERGLALATQAGDTELTARCLNVLGYAYNGTYQAQRALRAAEDSAARYAALGNPAMESDSLAQVACAYFRLGQPGAGLAAARRGLERSQSVDNTWGIINCQLQEAVALAEAGLLGQAQATALGAMQTAQAHGIGFMAVLAQITLATVLRQVFQLGEARRQLEAVSGMDTPESVTLRAAIELSAVCAELGDWPAARAQLGQMTPLQPHPLFLPGRALWLETEALLRAGEVERAHGYVAEWGAFIGDNPRAGLDHARAAATLDLFDGQPQAAAERLGRAVQAAAGLDLPGQLWPLLAHLARAEHAAGRPTAAQAAARQAEDIARRLADTLPEGAPRQAYLEGALRQIGREETPHDPAE